jgi:4-hydroxybenzoate polyprenyltransferase
VLALIAGAYVPLKRFLPKSVLTATGWTLAVVWLPGTPAPLLRAGLPVAVCLFLIVGANAILCDALDVDEDRRRGIRGLGPWLGAVRASRIASVLALTGAVLSFTLGPWPLAAAAAPLALAGLSPIPPHQREWRRTFFDLALVLPGLVAAFLPTR